MTPEQIVALQDGRLKKRPTQSIGLRLLTSLDLGIGR